MPHVASEATTRAFKPASPNPARPSQSSERAPDSPFDSLIDDATQAPAPQTPPTADKTAHAVQTDASTPPAASKGAKAAKPGANTPAAGATAAAETDPTATQCKVSGDGKVKAAATICAQAKAGEDSKPAGDGKTADASAATILPADPAAAAIQPVTPIAAVVTAPGPNVDATAAPADIPQAAPAVLPQAVSGLIPQTAAAVLSQAAPIVAGEAMIVAANMPKFNAPNSNAPNSAASNSAAPKTKPAEPDAAQADAEQAATVGTDAPKAEALDPSAAQADAGKPAAHPHDEAPAATRHVSTDTPPIAADAQAATPKTSGDVAQQAQITAPPPSDVSPASVNPAAPAPPLPQAAAVPLAGVAIEIASMAQAGKNRFEIRLDPPELGRIEVRLSVDRDGHATTSLIADRSDTLDLLRRDASGLERALQDAGLKTADNGLQFSLRDQSADQQQSNTPTPGAAQIVVQDNALPSSDVTQRNYSRLAGLRGGIDIRV